MSQLTKEVLIVNLLAPIDANNVTKTSDEVSFENYKHIVFVVQFGVIGAADSLITVEKCTTAGGASNDAMAFNYRVCGAAGGASEDTWGDLTACLSTGLTVATATDDGKCYAIEIDDNEAGDTHNFVRCIVDPGAVATLVSMLAICSEPRFKKAIMPTAIS